MSTSPMINFYQTSYAHLPFEKIDVRFTFPFESVILQKFSVTSVFLVTVDKVWASKIVP